MTYRSKYIDKIKSRRSSRTHAPVVVSKRVPVLTKSFGTETKRVKRDTVMRIPATAASFSTCGPISNWSPDEDGWHEDTYK